MQTAIIELDKPASADIIGHRPPERGRVSIRIRKYRHQNDYARIHELAERMHAESKYAHKPFSHDTLHSFLEQIDDVSTTGFVADHKKHGIIGFLCMTTLPYLFTPGTFAHDLALYVVPEHRHTLTFAALVRAGERWAAECGADAVMFGVSGPHNVERATRAYQKMGYAQWGVFLRKEVER